MPQPATNYISADMHDRFRVQAWNVWVVVLAVVALWVLLIVAAPLLTSTGISSSLYSFFSYICHQIPERSIHIGEHPMAVCSRCFGVYFGLMAGVVAYPLWRGIDEVEPVSRIWLFASLVPISIDWSLTMFGIWENTHVSRFLTGTILGIACATFIVPAVVDITRNLSRRRRSAQ